MPEQFTAPSVSEESIPLGVHNIIIALHNIHTVKVSSHHTVTPLVPRQFICNQRGDK